MTLRIVVTLTGHESRIARSRRSKCCPWRERAPLAWLRQRWPPERHSAKVRQGALVALSKGRDPNRPEIIAEGVLGVGRAASVAEDIRFALGPRLRAPLRVVLRTPSDGSASRTQ